jgi:DNA polymerase-1
MNDALALLTLYRELSSLIERDKQSDVLFGIEMPLCSVLTDMELEGFKIDLNGIRSYGEKLTLVESELEARIYFYAGQEFNIKSTKQLGMILFEVLGLPPSKKTKTG